MTPSNDPGRTVATRETSSGEAGALQTIHLIGRFDTRDPNGPRFGWPGSQIRARFSGTGATLRLRDSGADQLSVSIDGAPPFVIKTSTGSEVYSLATGLVDGEHDVVITKRTETFVGTAQLLDIRSTEGRPLVPTPRPLPRHIELIGDSITCGYGIHGANGSCSFSADTEDASASYAQLTATALQATHAAIAWSGIGVYRDYNGSTTDQMPVRFLRTLGDDASSRWDFSVVPDVVVVSLGTNDFARGDPGPAFETAYERFLADVRSKYPTAPILVALSPMLTASFPGAMSTRTTAAARLEAVVAARASAGDAKVSYFEFDEQNGAADGYGCGYHPGLTTHQKMSAKLVEAIKSVTGW
jgi:lysophospholipase L1-like esterase